MKRDRIFCTPRCRDIAKGFLAFALLINIAGCGPSPSSRAIEPNTFRPPVNDAELPEPVRKVLENAAHQIGLTTGYTQQYFVIPYPGGDLPANTGACTDVVIRAFRAAGIDLQKEVHEDMLSNFAAYPKRWGLSHTDTNIDHRRVPNLQVFFARRGKSLQITQTAEDYKPGDVVTWDLDGKGMTHIGLVSNVRDANTGRYMIIHNIGGGTRAEDRLFAWTVTGHFRYF